MVINYNSAKWYFCCQWSGYSGYRHPNHGHSLYPPPPHPPPPRVSCSALALACRWVQNQLFDTRFAVPRIDKGEFVCSCWWPELYLRVLLYFFRAPFFCVCVHFMVYSVETVTEAFWAKKKFRPPPPPPPPPCLLLFCGKWWRLIFFK